MVVSSYQFASSGCATVFRSWVKVPALARHSQGYKLILNKAGSGYKNKCVSHNQRRSSDKKPYTARVQGIMKGGGVRAAGFIGACRASAVEAAVDVAKFFSQSE